MMHYNHNVDVFVETFITYLCGIIDKHAPMKTKKVNQNNVPYMNSELRKLNYQRNMMRNIKNKHLALKILNVIEYYIISV